jgi:hypothetical protein
VPAERASSDHFRATDKRQFRLKAAFRAILAYFDLQFNCVVHNARAGTLVAQAGYDLSSAFAPQLLEARHGGMRVVGPGAFAVAKQKLFISIGRTRLKMKERRMPWERTANRGGICFSF